MDLHRSRRQRCCLRGVTLFTAARGKIVLHEDIGQAIDLIGRNRDSPSSLQASLEFLNDFEQAAAKEGRIADAIHGDRVDVCLHLGAETEGREVGDLL